MNDSKIRPMKENGEALEPIRNLRYMNLRGFPIIVKLDKISAKWTATPNVKMRASRL